MSCYTYNIILKLFIFWLKYNGLAIVRKTTKLIEGGHRGLQDYRHIWYTFFSKSNPKSRDFLRFFTVFSTFLELCCLSIVTASRTRRVFDDSYRTSAVRNYAWRHSATAILSVRRSVCHVPKRLDMILWNTFTAWWPHYQSSLHCTSLYEKCDGAIT